MRLESICRVLVAIGAWGTGVAATPGDLDPAFGSNGKLSSDVGCDLGVFASLSVTMVRDAEGFLYEIGWCTAPTPPANNQSPSQILVLKLDANGDRVTGFGNAGVATINTSDVDSSTAAAIDSSGNMYIVGQSIGLNGSVWKLDSLSGTLVTSFGTNGVKILTLDKANYYPNAVALDSAGNLYVAGESVGADYEVAVTKLDTNGNVIPSFGTSGTVTFSPGSNTISAAYALALDGTSDVYIAGISEPSDGSSDYDVVLAKLNASSGALVSTFGSGGTETFDFGSQHSNIVGALTFDGADTLYVAGTTYGALVDGSATGLAAVAKVDANTGALIAGFGSEGVKTIDITGDGSSASALSLDGSGNLYVAGEQIDTAAGTVDTLVSKLNTDGDFIAGFGTNGSKTFTISGNDFVGALLLDGIGHLYVAGVSDDFDNTNDTDRLFLAARLFTAENVSTTTLTSSLNPAVFGSTVTFTANVTGSGAIPTGKVTFRDGDTVICANITLVSGHATCSTSALTVSVSAHAISASYSGDANNLGSISRVVEQSILGDKIFKSGFE